VHAGQGPRREVRAGDPAGRRRAAGGAARHGGRADDGRAGALPRGRARRGPGSAAGRAGGGRGPRARWRVRRVPDEAAWHTNRCGRRGAPRRRGHQEGAAVSEGGQRRCGCAGRGCGGRAAEVKAGGDGGGRRGGRRDRRVEARAQQCAVQEADAGHHRRELHVVKSLNHIRISKIFFLACELNH
jgi:hypothetical protein